MHIPSSEEVLAHPSVYFSVWIEGEFASHGLASSVRQAKTFAACIIDGRPNAKVKIYHLVRAGNN